MQRNSTNVVLSIDALAKPVQHYDPSVFPDDTLWYRLFEHYVLTKNDNIRIIQTTGGDSRSSLVFPLIRIENKWRGITLESMQNYYSVDYRPLCSTQDAMALIAPTMAAMVYDESPDVIHLLPLDAEAPETPIIINALEELGWSVYASNCQVNWVHDFSGCFTDYIGALPGRLKSTLKRRGRKLMALDGFSMNVHDGVENLDEVLHAYQTIYSKSWKAPEPHDRFIPALISMMADKGQLRLGLLKIGERPVAVHFWIVKHTHAYIYKLAHDREFDIYSPGTVLMAEMVKHVMENDQVTRLDFMSGDDKYKQDWMSERREKISIMAYNSRSLHGRLAHFIDRRAKLYVRFITAWFDIGKLSQNSADKNV